MNLQNNFSTATLSRHYSRLNEDSPTARRQRLNNNDATCAALHRGSQLAAEQHLVRDAASTSAAQSLETLRATEQRLACNAASTSATRILETPRATE